MSSANCSFLEECVRNVGSEKSMSPQNAKEMIRQIVSDSGPFTLDQMVFHCSEITQKAKMSESEIMAIVSSVRRRNA